jgi:hypothetical protein
VVYLWQIEKGLIMINNSNELIFKVKIINDVDWTIIKIQLSDMERNDLNCDESLSILIMEEVYATDDRFYDDEENLVFEEENYWEDIIVPAHKKLYPMKYK